MKRILVGVDGSEAAAAALGWSGRLAHATDAEVIVAHVFHPDQAELSTERYDELRAAAEHRLETEWTAPLEPCEVTHRTTLLTGPLDELLDAADDLDADLVVVGPEAHGRFAALHWGSVAHHLAHHTRRPLAIVPSPGAPAPLERIVVGVDGSEGSTAAVHWCTDLASTTGAEVVAVYAFEPLAEWVRESDPHSWHQLVEREMREWVAPLRSAGVAVRTRIIKDIHPVAALASAIREEGAGLAVVGTRGLGGFLELRLGRVPVQLVHHSQIPVVLVPPTPARVAEPGEGSHADLGPAGRH
jgi:nucleotide-binding universal stress UspA family protein